MKKMYCTEHFGEHPRMAKLGEIKFEIWCCP